MDGNRYNPDVSLFGAYDTAELFWNKDRHRHDSRSVTHLVGLTQKERRSHTAAFGKSGTGKTTLMGNLILQDMVAGRGLMLVDPHGDLSARAPDWVPRERMGDVLYFDPADLNRPIGLDFFPHVPADERHLVVEQILSVFVKIWNLSDESTPQIMNILHYSLAALLETPGTSFLSLYRMLIDEDYRKAIVGNVKDPQVRQYWQQEFEPLSKTEKRRITASTLNKAGRLLTSPVIRYTLSQSRGKVDFGYLMNQSRIIIASLSKGRIGEEASRLLGNVLIINAYLAGLSRANIPERERKIFHLYVDEFPTFGGAVFENILSEARKYAMPLTLGGQFISQTSKSVRDAIFGNAGTVISFRVGSQDAKHLADEFDVPKEDFINLAQYQVIVRRTENGKPVTSDAIDALDTIPVSYGEGEQVRIQSVRQFARLRRDVEEEIADWFASPTGAVAG